MLKEKRLVLGGAAIAVLLGSPFMFFNGKGRAEQSHPQGIPTTSRVPSEQTAKEADDAASPLVDLPNTKGVRTESNSRKVKNARHDRGRFVERELDPSVAEVVSEEEWQVGLSDLPADKSDVVVEGEVTDAKAFLSNDETGVYSEFTIRVSRVLKASSNLSVNLDDALVMERLGGKVRYPSGKIIRYRVEGQGSPIRGKKYLFFLARIDQGDYKLLTAYEIQGQKVFALDGSRTNFRGRGDWVFDKHNGEDLDRFMERIQKAITDSQGGPQ